MLRPRAGKKAAQLVLWAGIVDGDAKRRLAAFVFHLQNRREGGAGEGEFGKKTPAVTARNCGKAHQKFTNTK